MQAGKIIKCIWYAYVYGDYQSGFTTKYTPIRAPRGIWRKKIKACVENVRVHSDVSIAALAVGLAFVTSEALRNVATKGQAP